MTQQRWPLLILSMLLAILLVYLSEETVTEPADLLQQAQESNADYIMTDVHMTQFDAMGASKSEIRAKSVSHFKQGSRLVFQSPEVHTRSTSTTWSLKAGSGNLSEVKDMLLLQKDVTMDAHLPDGHLQVRIEQLNVDLTKRVASSPLPLTVRMQNWLMTGQGLSIDVPEESIRIWHHVQATQM